MASIDEVNDALLNAIEDVMDKYENRSFGSCGIAVINGYPSRVAAFEIDGEHFHVTLQHLRSEKR